MLTRRSARLSQQAEPVKKRCKGTADNQAKDRECMVTNIHSVAATRAAGADREEKRLNEYWALRDAKRQRRREEAEEARATVLSFVAKAPSAAHHGSTPLPPDVWSRVFSFLAASTCPDPHRGAVAISRDIANASLACHDMHVAAAGAWRQLEEAAPITDYGVPYGLWSLSGGMTWEEWDKVFRNPNGCLVPLLKKAAKALGLPTSGTKAELVLRVYGELGLKEPVGTTAKLWVACQADKVEAQSWERAREWERRRKEEEERRRQEEERRKEQHRLMLAEHARRREEMAAMVAQRQQELQQLGLKALWCTCGNATPLACATRKCAKCCQGPCARHKKG